MITKTCAECGKPFETKYSKKLSCSNSCTVALERRQRQEKRQRNRIEPTLIAVTCGACGVVFPAKRTNAVWCGKRCQRRGLRDRNLRASSPEAYQALLEQRLMRQAGTEVLVSPEPVFLGPELPPDRCRGCGGRIVVRPLPFHDQRLCGHCNVKRNSRSDVRVSLIDR